MGRKSQEAQRIGSQHRDPAGVGAGPSVHSAPRHTNNHSYDLLFAALPNDRGRKFSLRGETQTRFKIRSPFGAA